MARGFPFWLNLFITDRGDELKRPIFDFFLAALCGVLSVCSAVSSTACKIKPQRRTEVFAENAEQTENQDTTNAHNRESMG